MSEPTATSTVESLIYRNCRAATHDEQVTALHALLPVIQSFAERLEEIEKSLCLLLQGQALIERHLAGAFGDDEPWRESLE